MSQLLVGYELKRAADYERAARDLLAQGQCKAVRQTHSRMDKRTEFLGFDH